MKIPKGFSVTQLTDYEGWEILYQIPYNGDLIKLIRMMKLNPNIKAIQVDTRDGQSFSIFQE